MSECPVTTAVVRSLYDALEAGRHGEALRALFTEDARTIEHPNVLKPHGAVSSLDAMLTQSTAGASLLESQRYEVHQVIESADRVAVRLTWTGVIAQDVGTFRAGQVLTAHIAQFITVREGRVASIETYDCYEPLARGRE
jgi:ketosteroid isomerase-like protein